MTLVTDATDNNLTYRIIGAAMVVHNEIGYGFKEEVYEKALEIKLNRNGIHVYGNMKFTLIMKVFRLRSFIWTYLPGARLLLRSKHSAIN